MIALIFLIFSLVAALEPAKFPDRCLSRQQFISASVVSGLAVLSAPKKVNAVARLKDVDLDVISSLTYEKELGKGSFKTVYLVSSDADRQHRKTYALAVERLRGKRDSREALQGIEVALKIAQKLSDRNENRMFEQVYAWWVQPSAPNDFERGQSVVKTAEKLSQRIPSSFLGSIWLLSLKPVYDMDLKKFAQATPILYPVGDTNAFPPSPIVAGIPLTNEGALKLTRDLCHIGAIMQQIGLVHRDIKPKNIMLSEGHPVIIDFGFAGFVSSLDKKRLCIVEPGYVKGELDYVLGSDVAKFQGCQEGDQYAMAKTIFNVLFGPALAEEFSGRKTITESDALEQNQAFWDLLSKEETFQKCRFLLSESTYTTLVSVVRGLAFPNSNLSFATAERLLNEVMDNHEKSI